MRATAAIVAVVLASASGANAAEVYRWVDANGKLHYADSPPPDVKAEKLNLKSAPTDPAAVEQAEAERLVRERHAEADAVVASNLTKETAAKAEQKAAECEVAKTRYEAAQHSRKFAAVDKDGKETWASGDEVVKLKEQRRAEMEAKCSS